MWCIEFSWNENEICKDYFFYHRCDLVDTFPSNIRKRVSNDSRRYKCTVGDNSCIYHVTKKKYDYLFTTGSNKHYRKTINILKEDIDMLDSTTHSDSKLDIEIDCIDTTDFSSNANKEWKLVSNKLSEGIINYF